MTPELKSQIFSFFNEMLFNAEHIVGSGTPHPHLVFAVSDLQAHFVDVNEEDLSPPQVYDFIQSSLSRAECHFVAQVQRGWRTDSLNEEQIKALHAWIAEHGSADDFEEASETLICRFHGRDFRGVAVCPVDRLTDSIGRGSLTLYDTNGVTTGIGEGASALRH